MHTVSSPQRPAYLRRALLISSVALLVLLAGCDTTGGEETVILTQDRRESPQVEFAFDPTAVQTGRLTVVDGNRQVDLATYLDQQGFTKQDILSAQLIGVELVLTNPILEDLSFLNQVILQFQADGSTLEVASLSEFPQDRRANLNVLDRDVSSFLERPDFGVALQVNPRTLMTENDDYRLTVLMRFRIEVRLE